MKFEVKVAVASVIWLVLIILLAVTHQDYWVQPVMIYPIIAILYLFWDFYFSGNGNRTKKPVIDYILLIIYLIFTLPIFIKTIFYLLYVIASTIFFFLVTEPIPYFECFCLVFMSVLLGIFLERGFKTNKWYYLAGLIVVFIAHLTTKLINAKYF